MNRQMRGHFGIYDEPESPIRGMFKIYDEPESPMRVRL